MDMLGLSQKTKQGNQFVAVMTARYAKLTKTIPMSKTNSTTVVSIFLELWLLNFRILQKSLTESHPQFVSKFFMAVYSTVVVNTINTTEYRRQAHDQAEH